MALANRSVVFYARVANNQAVIGSHYDYREWLCKEGLEMPQSFSICREDRIIQTKRSICNLP